MQRGDVVCVAGHHSLFVVVALPLGLGEVSQWDPFVTIIALRVGEESFKRIPKKDITFRVPYFPKEWVDGFKSSAGGYQALERAKPNQEFERAKPDQARNAASPDQARDAASPDQARDAASPDQARDAASPDQARDAASPNQARDAASPDQTLKAASPNQARDAASPDQARDAASPDQARNAASPDQARDAASPDQTLEAASPPPEFEAASPPQGFEAALLLNTLVEAAAPLLNATTVSKQSLNSMHRVMANPQGLVIIPLWNLAMCISKLPRTSLSDIRLAHRLRMTCASLVPLTFPPRFGPGGFLPQALGCSRHTLGVADLVAVVVGMSTVQDVLPVWVPFGQGASGELFAVMALPRDDGLGETLEALRVEPQLARDFRAYVEQYAAHKAAHYQTRPPPPPPRYQELVRLLKRVLFEGFEPPLAALSAVFAVQALRQAAREPLTKGREPHEPLEPLEPLEPHEPHEPPEPPVAALAPLAPPAAALAAALAANTIHACLKTLNSLTTPEIIKMSLKNNRYFPLDHHPQLWSLAVGLLPSSPQACLDQQAHDAYVPEPQGPDPVARERRDFGALPVYCIDGAATADGDDGISLKRHTDRRWEIFVHVADPASYVAEPPSAIAQIALRRAASVYLPVEGERAAPALGRRGRVLTVPMLPRALTLVARIGGANAGAGASTHAHTHTPPTRCVTYSFTLDPQKPAADLARRFADAAACGSVTPGLVRRVHRLTYDAVDKEIAATVFQEGVAAPRLTQVQRDFRDLLRVATLIRQARARNAELQASHGEPQVSHGEPQVSHTTSHATSHTTSHTTSHATSHATSHTTSHKPQPQETASGWFTDTGYDDEAEFRAVLTDRETPSRTLVGELMLMTNHLAGRFFRHHQIPGIFRCLQFLEDRAAHSSPLRGALSAPNSVPEFGTDFALLQPFTPRPFYATGTAVPGHDLLGVDCYLPSTSPLRQLSGLINQWQLHRWFLKKPPLFNTAEMTNLVGTLQAQERVNHVAARQSQLYLEKKGFLSSPKQWHSGTVVCPPYTTVNGKKRPARVNVRGGQYWMEWAAGEVAPRFGDRVRCRPVHVDLVGDELVMVRHPQT